METNTQAILDINLSEPKSEDKVIQEIFDSTKTAIGFIPNMYLGMANNKSLLDAYSHSYVTFRHNSGFNPIEQEIIFLTISYENDCEYCMNAHTTVADKFTKIPLEITDAIRTGTTIPDEKLGALSQFTKTLVNQRGRADAEELNSFINAGYTKDNVLSIITAIGVKTFSNYYNHLADTPLDEAFSERPWKK